MFDKVGEDGATRDTGLRGTVHSVYAKQNI